MADTNTPPSLNIEKIYIKDLSLEVPNAPQIFHVQEQQEQPQISVQLHTEGKQIEGETEHYEAKLVITVKATLPEDRSLFLVEVAQAGIFTIQNVPETEIDPILSITCQEILFPYAREAISSALIHAGFIQPLLLNPVNFGALYMARQQQLAQQAQQAAVGGVTPQTVQ
jgi:preprotein translocase subunit SecB